MKKMKKRSGWETCVKKTAGVFTALCLAAAALTSASPALVSADEAESVSSEAETAGTETAGTDQDAEALSSVQVYVGSGSEIKWSDRSNGADAKVEWPTLGLSEEDRERYPGLAEAFDAFNEERKTDGEERYAQMLEDVQEQLENNPDLFGGNFESEVFYVQRADEKLVSFLGDYTSYNGGVHGYHASRGVTFETSTGKMLTLGDLVTDLDAFKQVLKEKVREQYPETEEDLVDQYFTSVETDLYNWTAGPLGITCYFNPYDLGPYAIGAQKVLVPYEDYASLYAADAAAAPDTYGVGFPMFDTWDFGEKSVCVYGSKDEYDEYSSVTVIVNDAETTEEIHAFEIRPAYVRTGAGDFLYMDLSIENDAHVLDIWQLGDTAERIGQLDLGRGFIYDEKTGFFGDAALSDPDNMLLSTRSDILGTASCERHYRTGEDGMPAPIEQSFTYVTGRTLTLKQDLNCETVGEDGETNGAVTLPAGTGLTMLRTDKDTYVDLASEDGQVFRVFVETASWPQTIDGTDIEELFEGILFAG